jgi:hypothetical protein
MRPFTMLALLTLLLLTAVAPSVAGARPRSARGAGAAEIETTVRFAFKATGTPRRASGRITYEEPANQLELTADVTCLRVDGEIARLTGKLRRPITGEGTPLTHIQLEVFDGGRGGPPSQDFITVVGADKPIPCGRGRDVSMFPLTGGNIRVR